jgi:type I restriction enzyme S subunit
MKWPSRPISELCTLAVDCVNKTAPTVDYETPFKMIRTTNDVAILFRTHGDVRHR